MIDARSDFSQRRTAILGAEVLSEMAREVSRGPGLGCIIAGSFCLLASPVMAQMPTLEDGWIRLGNNDTQIVFVRPFVGQTRPFSRVWSRFETKPERQPEPQAASAIELRAIDCGGGRSRVLQGTLYKGRYLTGVSTEVEESEWTYVVPGSLGELRFNWACAKTTEEWMRR